ncbi:MAG: sugar transferase [Candidatus Pacebacteria bacterium]|nr:sugar transferase [Candidatus Paceibacterota bacterium]
MKILNRRGPIVLFLGDLAAFSVSLWFALAFRYGSIPSSALLRQHILPFSILFIFWATAFFIAGLYEKHTLVFKGKLPALILNTQVINSFIAVLFFYLVPFFGITPKTILATHLVFFSILIIFWRIVIVPRLGFRERESAIIIGAGSEMKELLSEVNGNKGYNITFVSSVDLDQMEGIAFQEEVIEQVYSEGVSSIVIDLKYEKSEKILASFYNLIFSNVRFFDMHKVYEEVFDRIPFSLLEYNWFLENISLSPHTMYDVLKRAMDIVIAGVLGIISLVLYPFVILAIKLEDGGPAFITQERIGKGNRLMKLMKFRSMKKNDLGVWPTEGDVSITKVGGFLRKSRIDELPQLWNVVKGDLSLIGPRPDIIDLGKTLAKEIPYYTVRNLIKPGLSGWAQIKQDLPPHSLAETKLRLSYDLYYIKNRSFVLDLTIALKTIKVLLSRKGL